VDATRAELIQGLEGLNKIFLNFNMPVKGVDLRRTLTSVVPQQNDLYDSVLEQVPEAVKAFSNEDVTKAQKLLQQVAALEAAERKAANWGYGIQSHHPNELIMQYVATGDLPMYQSLQFNDLAKQAGLKFGTQREQQYGITQPGHVVAHTNQRTQATGSFGSNENTAAQFRQLDIYERFDAFLPSAMTEAEYSRLAYELPQERNVRQGAARLLGISTDQLVSTERDPNQRKNGNVTIANRNRDKLPKPIMQGLIDVAYGTTKPELVIPKLELVTPQQGKNKGVQRVEPVKDPASGELDRLIRTPRPGEVEVLRRMGLRF